MSLPMEPQILLLWLWFCNRHRVYTYRATVKARKAMFFLGRHQSQLSLNQEYVWRKNRKVIITGCFLMGGWRHLSMCLVVLVAEHWAVGTDSYGCRMANIHFFFKRSKKECPFSCQTLTSLFYFQKYAGG